MNELPALMNAEMNVFHSHGNFNSFIEHVCVCVLMNELSALMNVEMDVFHSY
jgi:hypothetical protein